MNKTDQLPKEFKTLARESTKGRMKEGIKKSFGPNRIKNATHGEASFEQISAPNLVE